MKTNCAPKASAGFTFIELIIVITIVGLLAAIALPNLFKARDNGRLNVIYRNLRSVETAKDQWAIDNHQVTGALVGDVATLTNYFRAGAISTVVRETYVPNPVGTRAEADLPAGVNLGPFPAGGIIPAP